MALPPEAPLPRLLKTLGGRDVSARGAFPARGTLTLTARVPRALGAAAVVLRLARDGEDPADLPLRFHTFDKGWDEYRLPLSLSELAGERGEGLFYYEFLFLRGADTLFTDTADNVTFSLAPHAAGRFRLLLHETDFDTPAWFAGRTMYHIFVDRFAPGGGERRADAVYHEKWDEEIEQFGAFAGAPVANNEFFGGTLTGITEKLDYLASLGVGILYLSPVFRAASNHKYDTGDYGEVDPQFGGERALRELFDAAHKRGMAVMLDGVFNHTGDDSRYFNRYGHYPDTGAYQSETSPYRNWYHFKEFPDTYECWWGVKILPKLNLSDGGVCRYLVGEGGIVEKYTRLGADAWRLDVADELPDAFLDALRERVKTVSGEHGAVLGEVWENAADKISYGVRRRYLRGRQLDSVMNYPLRNALIAFARDGDAPFLAAALRELWGSYPDCVCHALMNILSTHDTERILTVLGGECDDGSFTNDELRDKRMPRAVLETALARLRVAATLQYTAFGVPSLFYGDEAGLEGYHDPFCRRPFPWGREDRALLAFYRKLGAIRAENPVLARGDFRILRVEAHAIVWERADADERLIVAANRDEIPFTFRLPRDARELITDTVCRAGGVTLAPCSAGIWRLS